ncbi:hypothetical protein M2160_003307 [Streptomyces sp. SAI-117]|nr:hypothetical protein [Streptomyces sp. SAI-117]
MSAGTRGRDGAGAREAGAEGAGARGSAGGERHASGERGPEEAGVVSAGTRGRDGAGAEAAGASAGSVRKSAPGAGREAGTGEAGVVRDTDGVSEEAAEPGAEAEMVVRDAISAPDVDGRPRRATRRFPLFTRDTARPEGGGRAAPRDAPAPARQWPVLSVLAVVGLGLLLTALDQFRWGTLFIGLALLAGAVLRWLLPDVGMLAVRSRFTDIATYGVLGTAIVLLAMMVQPNPWLEIPFLKDTLHFTVSNS